MVAQVRLGRRARLLLSGKVGRKYWWNGARRAAVAWQIVFLLLSHSDCRLPWYAARAARATLQLRSVLALTCLAAIREEGAGTEIKPRFDFGTSGMLPRVGSFSPVF